MTTSTIRSKQGSKIKKGLRTAAAALFWLAVWQCAAFFVGKEVLIPSPAQVLLRLWQLAGQAEFWITAFSSLWRVLLGFAAALAAGVLLAVLTAASRVCRSLLQPLVFVIRATPVASFIILALVWLQSARVPVFISFLTVVPIVWANVESGILQTDGRLLEMARLYRFSRRKTLRNIYLPSVQPYFLSAFTTGLGFAWKSGIAAEVIANTRRSIGGQIYSAKVYLETTDLFAWTLVVIALSMLLEKLLVHAVLRLTKRRRGGTDG
ncbi:MAG: ABC transporter permease subunit [Firmicutes bacterium]|nr:ABC transporter permease subunit [Bacillota bacterium]